jgi:MYXO-CTERM domain-containing protein
MRRTTRSALTTLSLLATMTAGVAHAQTTPRVLVIFDTSGSMLWDYEDTSDCRGDGSVEFPHRTCALGSKMFFAKQAMSQIVRDSNDVEFGLMRYRQLEPGDAGFGVLQQEVGAQYRNGAGTILDINYDGASRPCDGADLLVRPSANSRASVLSWMDNRENYPANKELRANGYTPLTHAIDDASVELRGVIRNDPESTCRPYFVLLLTDGRQQCPDEDAADPADRQRIRDALTSGAAGLRALNVDGNLYDVRTFVVGFGPGTEFAPELDAMARSGGTAVNAAGNVDLRAGRAYQAADPQSLVAVLNDAIAQAQPRELCDGADNNCDGRVDEGFGLLGAPCSVGNGACQRDGQIVCAPSREGTICSVVAGDPQAEACNGNDDDCDGQVDEGVLNACGGCGAVQDELCDGIDNDCDGVPDDGVLNRCGTCGPLPVDVCNGRDDDCDDRTDEGVLNACGACGDVPSEVCNCSDDDCDRQIDEGMNCPACDCAPSPEVCDGRDNDCDNEVDDGVLNRCGQCGLEPAEICNRLDDDCDGRFDEAFPQQGVPCGTNEGECVAGIPTCVDGEVICRGEVAASPEVCDGLDNNCDGEIDEGAYNTCGYCGNARLEVCDNVDNDCEGSSDQGVLCRGEDACVNGECAPPCQFGECVDDLVCVGGFCVSPCYNTDCADGFVCQDGRCADPCDGIACPAGTYCSLAQCIPDDCYGPRGCPDGQRCQQGQCQADPCATAGCGPEQGCQDGRCFDSCDVVQCAAGEVCQNGACVNDPCARVVCEYPLVCDGGGCVPDPCFEVDCGPGFMCEAGQCVEDPCGWTVCPEGYVCHRGECAAGDGASGPGSLGAGNDAGFGTGNDPNAQSKRFITGDGCGCNAQATSSSSVAGLLALGVIGVIRRRRSRGV